MKIKTFFWEGLDKNGIKTQGEIKALNIRLAKFYLKDKKIIKIKRKFYSHISNQDIINFLKQLSLLISSYMPLLQSLETIYKTTTKKDLKTMILNIQDIINDGYPLSYAFKKQKTYFDEITCQLILQGEKSGKLDIMLKRIVNYKEKIKYTKNKIKKALFYPFSIIIIAIIITFIFLNIVIPQFATLFDTFDQKLPLPTRIVISISNVLKHYSLLIFFILLTISYIVLLIKRYNKKVSLFFDKILIKIPFIGDILKKMFLIRFISTLELTFSSGIPIAEVLKSLHFITNNEIFNKATRDISKFVNKGSTINNAILKTKTFPEMVVQMVAIGEETGKLDIMFQKITDFYETEIENTIEYFLQLLEPIITIILGIIIGSLIVAMYLPIFKLGMIF